MDRVLTFAEQNSRLMQRKTKKNGRKQNRRKKTVECIVNRQPQEICGCHAAMAFLLVQTLRFVFTNDESWRDPLLLSICLLELNKKENIFLWLNNRVRGCNQGRFSGWIFLFSRNNPLMRIRIEKCPMKVMWTMKFYQNFPWKWLSFKIIKFSIIFFLLVFILQMKLLCEIRTSHVCIYVMRIKWFDLNTDFKPACEIRFNDHIGLDSYVRCLIEEIS